VEQLLGIVAIKNLCRRAHIEKVEAGPKGIVVAFRDNSFANPGGLLRYVSERGSFAKVRPDMRVVFIGDYEKPEKRLRETRRLLSDLVRIAEGKKASALACDDLEFALVASTRSSSDRVNLAKHLRREAWHS
jgi:transcription-repair coupling factor (superfamily II helicase)